MNTSIALLMMAGAMAGQSAFAQARVAAQAAQAGMAASGVRGVTAGMPPQAGN
ncbi:hypothetical protein [Burkholderia anthina]|uniref:hypothetical protein n=1 Tax=Burkholderia anthina TaxID=179879 RepID=UPI001589DF4D|nr:hypothetical protein [Burkholderia anthina]